MSGKTCCGTAQKDEGFDVVVSGIPRFCTCAFMSDFDACIRRMVLWRVQNINTISWGTATDSAQNEYSVETNGLPESSLDQNTPWPNSTSGCDAPAARELQLRLSQFPIENAATERRRQLSAPNFLEQTGTHKFVKTSENALRFQTLVVRGFSPDHLPLLGQSGVQFKWWLQAATAAHKAQAAFGACFIFAHCGLLLSPE